MRNLYTMGVGLVIAIRANTPEEAEQAVVRASERFQEGLTGEMEDEGPELVHFSSVVREARRVIPDPDPEIWGEALDQGE